MKALSLVFLAITGMLAWMAEARRYGYRYGYRGYRSYRRPSLSLRPNPFAMTSWRSSGSPPPNWSPDLIYDRYTRDRRLKQIVASIRLFMAYKRANPFDWRGIRDGYRVLAPLIAVSSGISLPRRRYMRFYHRYIRWRNHYYRGYRRFHMRRFRDPLRYVNFRYGMMGSSRYWRPWQDQRYLRMGSFRSRRCRRRSMFYQSLPHWMRRKYRRWRRHHRYERYGRHYY